MANQKLTQTLSGALCAAMILCSAASAPAQQKTPMQIGTYSIANYRNVNTVQKPNGDVEFIITSGGNVPLEMHSPDYDITTPRVAVTYKRTREQGQSERGKVTEVVCTGGVKLVNRNRQNGQKTIITGNEARYTATMAVKDRGIVTLNGNVRSEVQGIPSMATPLILTGTKGVAKFLADGSLSVDITDENNNGTIKGQIYEPAPKGKQP